jgi:hypothetical protein
MRGLGQTLNENCLSHSRRGWGWGRSRHATTNSPSSPKRAKATRRPHDYLLHNKPALKRRSRNGSWITWTPGGLLRRYPRRLAARYRPVERCSNLYATSGTAIGRNKDPVGRHFAIPDIRSEWTTPCMSSRKEGLMDYLATLARLTRQRYSSNHIWATRIGYFRWQYIYTRSRCNSTDNS